MDFLLYYHVKHGQLNTNFGLGLDGVMLQVEEAVWNKIWLMF